MSQHRLSHLLDVVGQNEVSAAHGRQGLSRSKESDGGSRAPSEVHVLMLAGRLHELQEVLAHAGIDVNLPHRLLAGDEIGCRNDRRQVVDRMAMLEAFEHLAFFGKRGVAKAQADEEPVELRFRQRERYPRGRSGSGWR